MRKIKTEEIKKGAKKEIKNAKSLKELDEIFRKYLGKKGEIKALFKLLPKLPKKERPKWGKKLEELKNFLEKELERKAQEIKEKIEKEKKEFFDITLPGKKIEIGHLHPLTLVRRKIEEIFQSMGFEIADGPEIEDEWHNFDALNVPPDHPARDILSLGKTFYLKDGGLLRSHTSAVQIRYMEKNNPPIKIIAPGRVFRAEATDASHETDIYQVEGLMVDKEISVANFKAIIEEFLSRFFEKQIRIRLRPSFFPFTEPSFEIDISCPMCGEKGCPTCQNSGWIELMGAGMVHPKVLKNCNIDPKEWQGFAFGLGMDRLTMLKYKIPDIRLLRSNDLRFLKQF